MPIRNAERKVLQAELEFNMILFSVFGCRWAEAVKSISPEDYLRRSFIGREGRSLKESFYGLTVT